MYDGLRKFQLASVGTAINNMVIKILLRVVFWEKNIDNNIILVGERLIGSAEYGDEEKRLWTLI